MLTKNKKGIQKGSIINSQEMHQKFEIDKTITNKKWQIV
jgi:hypothetical protein